MEIVSGSSSNWDILTMHGYIDFSDILPTHILLAYTLSWIWTKVLPCCKICKKRWVIVSSSGVPYLITESL